MDDQVTQKIIVKTDLDHAYDLWANFENFPHFMKNIESVQMTGPQTSHWVMKGPMGTTLEWDAETTRKEENKRIGWNTKDNDADVVNSGEVTFNDLPQHETEITVTMHYEPNKAGLAGDVVSALFGNPEEKLEEDLRNFKAFAEERYRRVDG